MQAYDVLMILVLVGATVFGCWKGMAWQIASLASLILSYCVALKFSTQLAPVFGDQEPLNRFIAMLVLYLATSAVIWILFRVVAGFIDRVRLREWDRQIGALFGLVKGVLLCVAITLFAVSLLSEPQRKTVMESRSGYYIALLLDEAHGVMPEEIHDVLHPYIHRAQQRLDPTHPDHEEHAIEHAGEPRDTAPATAVDVEDALGEAVTERLRETLTE